MTKAEQFIKDCTRDCSNELISVQDRFHNEVISYREWLTPEQALRAVDMEREELLDKAYEWLQKNDSYSKPTELQVRDFRKYMEEEL